MHKFSSLFLFIVFALNVTSSAIEFEKEKGLDSKSLFSSQTDLEKAQEAEKAGRYAEAAAYYADLEEEFLIPANRAKALQRSIQLYMKAGLEFKALQKTHRLVQSYANFVSVGAEIHKHLEAVRKFDAENSKKSGLLHSPSEVITFYQDYLTMAPESRVAPAIYLRIGRLYAQTNDLESAAIQYKTIINNYRKTRESGYARVLLAKYYTSLLNNADLDMKSLQEAKLQLLLFKREFKRHPYQELAEKDLAKILEIEALRYYNLGVFYLRKDTFRLKAAKRYLYSILLHYRHTAIAKDAKKLLARIENDVENKIEDQEKQKIAEELKSSGIALKSAENPPALIQPLPPQATDVSKREVLISPENSDGRFLLPVENLFPIGSPKNEILPEEK